MVQAQLKQFIRRRIHRLHRRRMRRDFGQHGYTLVELLIVFAVIGLLMALLLPTIQAARAAARRTVCLSNLHQIGIALNSYHAAHRSFPVGGLEPRWTAAQRNHRQLAWSAFLLPYLEEQELFDQLQLDKPFDSPENAAAAARVLPVFLCPATERESMLVESRGPSDYGGIFGERILSPNQPPKGTMLYDKTVSLKQITDGASRTFIVAEDSGFHDGQWINGKNLFDQAFAINSAPAFENDIRSEHIAGAQAAYVDGSARFIRESIDLKVLAALCTRAGND